MDAVREVHLLDPLPDRGQMAEWKRQFEEGTFDGSVYKIVENGQMVYVPIPALEISNVVLMTKLTHQIDLEKLANSTNYYECSTRSFPSLVQRVRSGCTVSIYSSGKIVCTGARSITGAKLGVEEAKDILCTIFRGAETFDDKVQQIVVTARVFGYVEDALLGSKRIPVSILIQDLHDDTKSHDRIISKYNPHGFPGCIVRVDPVIFLVFVSGAVNIMGTRDLGVLHEMWRRFFTTVVQHYIEVGSKVKSSADYKLIAMRNKNQERIRAGISGPLESLKEDMDRISAERGHLAKTAKRKRQKTGDGDDAAEGPPRKRPKTGKSDSAAAAAAAAAISDEVLDAVVGGRSISVSDEESMDKEIVRQVMAAVPDLDDV